MFFIDLPSEINADMCRYMNYHGVKVIENKTLVIPLRCSMLKNGRCSIYPTRPDHCKAYECEGDKLLNQLRQK
jgi:Fe-S-cluster containining protein